jgi:hypothetical protein
MTGNIIPGTGLGVNMLILAASLCFLIGLAHSTLGERYILTRLFRSDSLPKLFGDDWFTRRTLRFAWHITTLMGWGFGVLLLLVAQPAIELRSGLLITVAVTFAACGLLALGFTRGRHLSWLVFFAVGALAFFAATNIEI